MTEKKMRIGLIGSGSRGVNCFGQVISSRDDAEVVALYDPNPVRMALANKQLGGKCKEYSSIEEMLKSEDLDGVTITSPDYCHEANAVAALNAGANVLLDKPIATTAQGGLNIINAAKKNEKIAMMGFNLRHGPTMKRLKEIVDEGVLGKIFMIENREFYDGGRTYMARWNRKYEWSGGLWIHKGSHDFDVFNYLLGFPKPERVSAFAAVNVLNKENIPFEVKDDVPVGPTCTACKYADICPDCKKAGVTVAGEHVTNLFTDETAAQDDYRVDVCMYISDKSVHDNGVAIVEYEGGIKASHVECFICNFSDRKYTVIGDRGIAEVSLHDRTIKVLKRWKRGEEILYTIPEVTGGHGGADPSLVDSFIRTIKGEISNKSTMEHGMWSTAIGQAAEISWREHRMVEIKELFD